MKLPIKFKVCKLCFLVTSFSTKKQEFLTNMFIISALYITKRPRTGSSALSSIPLAQLLACLCVDRHYSTVVPQITTGCLGLLWNHLFGRGQRSKQKFLSSCHLSQLRGVLQLPVVDFLPVDDINSLHYNCKNCN